MTVGEPSTHIHPTQSFSTLSRQVSVTITMGEVCGCVFLYARACRGAQHKNIIRKISNSLSRVEEYQNIQLDFGC